MRPASIRSLVVLLACLASQASSCPLSPQCPACVEQAMARCHRSLDAGALEDARASCAVCLEYDHANPECTNLMGLYHYLGGDAVQARDWYKRAIRYRNDFPEARNNLGVLVMEQDGDDQKAITLFSSALKIDPGYADARWNLALAHSHLAHRQFARAQERLKQRVDAGDPRVLQQEYAAAEEEHALVEDALRRLVDLHPNHVKAYFLLGYVASQRARCAATLAEAWHHLERAERWDRQCVDLADLRSLEGRQCRGNLAAVLEARGRCAEARSSYVGCLAAEPRDGECLAGMARTAACVAVQQGALSGP